MAAVLDTSAVLAWIHGESGEDVVDPLLSDAVMSSLNWSELALKLQQHGVEPRPVSVRLQALGIVVEAFTPRDALNAAELWPSTRRFGLSLGDRACLALAQRLELPVVTADQAWTGFEFVSEVRLIR
ncbi:PIN domain-containing protein [Arthrobacter pigmenti]